LDELSGIMKRPALDNWSWLAAAKVEEMDV